MLARFQEGFNYFPSIYNLMNQYHYSFSIWKSVAAQILHRNHAVLGHFFDASHYSNNKVFKKHP